MEGPGSPVQFGLGTQTSAGAGVGHHSSGRFSRRENRKLLIAHIHVVEGSFGPEILLYQTDSRFKIPGRFRLVTGVLCANGTGEVIKVHAKIFHQRGHRLALENIGKNLGIEATGPVSLRNASKEGHVAGGFKEGRKFGQHLKTRRMRQGAAVRDLEGFIGLQEPPDWLRFPGTSSAAGVQRVGECDDSGADRGRFPA